MKSNNNPCLPDIQPYGDYAFLITFSEAMNPLANQRVYQLESWLEEGKLGGVIESIPAYASLMVVYDALAVSADRVSTWLQEKIATCAWESSQAHRLIEVPVVYGGEDSVDLQTVANTNHLSPEEVINIHCQAEYTVAMMGFMPGFVYLRGMDERLATPRLASPRTRVQPGSVGIAGNQTGIYSIASPGGWQIIGRTSLVLFDPDREAPFLFSPGDHVRFVPVVAGEIT
jgi:inhibitor of KinA